MRRVLDALDDLLSEPHFREIGRLHELPTANQVLLKREGYRQIFSTFALIESNLGLQLELDDAIHPSQRNVAALYEYWTFLKLAEVVGEACHDPRAPLKLFRDHGDGLSLGLKRGQQSTLPWEVVVAGRRLGVTLFFNRTFRVTDERCGWVMVETHGARRFSSDPASPRQDASRTRTRPRRLASFRCEVQTGLEQLSIRQGVATSERR